jgi:hypothetical protein
MAVFETDLGKSDQMIFHGFDSTKEFALNNLNKKWMEYIQDRMRNGKPCKYNSAYFMECVAANDPKVHTVEIISPEHITHSLLNYDPHFNVIEWIKKLRK